MIFKDIPEYNAFDLGLIEDDDGNGMTLVMASQRATMYLHVDLARAKQLASWILERAAKLEEGSQ